MGDQNPYERLLVGEKVDLKGYRPKIVSLALGSENLFSDMVESQRWISRIIRECVGDEARISGKAVLNDAGDCLAKMPIEILGGQKALIVILFPQSGSTSMPNMPASALSTPNFTIALMG